MIHSLPMYQGTYMESMRPMDMRAPADGVLNGGLFVRNDGASTLSICTDYSSRALLPMEHHHCKHNRQIEHRGVQQATRARLC